MKKYKIILLMILIVIFPLLTGCWDRVEMEDRAFVLGIGLDKGEKKDEIALTYQIAIPSAMFGEGDGKGGEKQFLNLTATARSIIRADKQLLTRVNKTLNNEHTYVLIIGEDLAKEGISSHIDYFLRDIDMRRRTNVLVAEGKAQDYFKYMPPIAKSTSDYLSKIIELNEKRVHRISSRVDILEMAKNLRRETDFILQKIVQDKDGITMAGAGVFKKDKLIGYLSPDDVRKVKWLKNDISQGTIELMDVDGIKGLTVLEISEGRTQVKPRIYEENVDFDVNIRLEGDIVEMESMNFDRTVSKEFINVLEKKVEEKVKKECSEIMRKAQDEFKADFFDFGHLVKNYNIRWWKQHEKEWRDIFKQSKLNVKVDVNIRRVGLIE
jgi:Ger(x)C family germination protein